MINGNNIFIDFNGESLLFSHPNPTDESGESIAYKLIHSDKPLTRAERLRVASVIESYSQLINRETNETRNKKANAIKRELKKATNNDHP